MKKIIILLIVSSCTVTRPTVFRIISAKREGCGSIVRITNLRGLFYLPSDTLKPNDVITITWMKRLPEHEVTYHWMYRRHI
jgi:hypothetical protein